MKTKNLQRLLFTGLYSTLVVSALGTMAGTFAWFTYNSRMSAKFHGTSLSDSANLKVGVVSDIELPEAEDYGFIKDQENENIYWSEKGISAESLSYFLSASGYASDALTPVTSGSYQLYGNFSLKNRPTYLANNNTPAKKKFYINLPLVFQAEDKKTTYNTFDVRLSKILLDDKENGNLSKAIRINFLNQADNENFLMNPSVIDNGYDVVGGALDIDLDGYNDNNGNKDFVYGEVDNVTYSDEASIGGEPLPLEQRTVFNALTRAGCYSIDEEESIFGRSEYLGKESVIAKKDIASANGDGLAYTTLTIYEEGWSLAAVDSAIGNVFDLDLTFELFNETNI